jgi:signal transduction histidine kinase
VTYDVMGDQPVVEADPDLLRQAVFNLVLNACQMAEPGGWIRARVTAAGRTVTLTVDDSGPGVPPDEREEIFRPYYTLRPEGTGLGLAVVDQIATGHGWKLACDENETGGARFVIGGLETETSS